MKIDELRNMKRDRKEPLSEQETLELRLDLLNQQEQEKLKSNNELLKTLNALNKNITEANREIQRNVDALKHYPGEAAQELMQHLASPLEACKQSAQKASAVYTEAKKMINLFEGEFSKHLLLWMGASALGASLITATLVVWTIHM